MSEARRAFAVGMFVSAAACAASRAGAQDPYGGQPFSQQPQFNPNNMIIAGPPADTGAPTRPAGWPGAPDPAPAPAREPLRRPPAVMNPAAQSAGAPGSSMAPPPAVGAEGPRAVATGAAPSQPPPRDPNWTEDAQNLKYDLTDFDGARRIAQVGTEVIQDYEVSSYVNEFIEQNSARIPPGQLAMLREKLTKERLSHLIEIKLALVDAQRKVPSEAYPKIVESIGDEFERTELRNKLKQLKLKSRSELDAKLREQGSSLEREKQAYIEQSLAFGWVREQTRIKHEITHADMLAYYLEHAADYDFSAKARWEELRVRVSNYPSREAARLVLGSMGNAVLRGANFADVARARSQGPTAAAGGINDWTSRGSLSLDVLDQAIFSLPVGQMSPILDDGRAPTISIVRVIERIDAGRTPFTEVQQEIKKKIGAAQADKEKEKIHDYITRLRAETPIWTIYEGDLASQGEAMNQPGSAKATTSTSLRPAAAPGGTRSGNAPPDNPYLR